MTDNLVKVTIADGYTGHKQAGKLCEPGDEIEVYQSQEKWLRSIGALAPRKSASKKRKDTADQEDSGGDSSD